MVLAEVGCPSGEGNKRMPYSQLEELTSRKREKVALFLTAENMAGLLAIGLPAYIGTLGVSIWLRILILIAAGILGVALTSEVNGMAFYERALWWVRGRVRRRMTSAIVRPIEFTVAPVVQGDRALLLGGPLRRVKRSAPDVVSSNRLARVVRTAAVPRYRSTITQQVPTRDEGSGETDVSASNGHSSPRDAVTAVLVEDGLTHHFEG